MGGGEIEFAPMEAAFVEREESVINVEVYMGQTCFEDWVFGVVGLAVGIKFGVVSLLGVVHIEVWLLVESDYVFVFDVAAPHFGIVVADGGL